MLSESKYVERAQAAVRFLRQHMYRESDGCLLRAAYVGGSGSGDCAVTVG